VPPIFQPEVAARAIVYAASHQRREFLVGGSTVLAVMADKLAPDIADRYLAATAIDGQQTDEREDPNRPDNVDQPVAGHHATHGRFDARASDSSVQWWLTTHRPVVVTAALGGVGLIAAAMRGLRSAR
jgi:hypothetical protein